jgi:hypothetical protein
MFNGIVGSFLLGCRFAEAVVLNKVLKRVCMAGIVGCGTNLDEVWGLDVFSYRFHQGVPCLSFNDINIFTLR